MPDQDHYATGFRGVFRVIDEAVARAEKDVKIAKNPAAKERLRGERDALVLCQKAMARKMNKRTKKQDELGKNTYTGFNARWTESKRMTTWPEFPKDQLELPGMPAPKREREDATRGGRVQEKGEIDRRTLCPRCGEMRTAGLPCPHCSDAVK